MKTNIFFIISLAIAFVGGISLAYQVYKITVIDANARGLKHPKFWGLFSIGGQNGSGILLYIIGRKKYPIINLNQEEQSEMLSRKKRAGVSIAFLAISAISLIINIAIFS